MEQDVRPTGAAEGEHCATGAAPVVKRWSANRTKEAVLRLVRGEPVDTLSREPSIEICRLEEWRDKALQGIDTALKSRGNDPLSVELDAAMRRIGEISMENELLRERIRKKFPLAKGRSKR